MLIYIGYIIIGLLAGSMSGLLGIGGGVIIIPALIYIFGLTQQQAQGTTLAMMIPPIGLFAVWVYYKNGYVNIPMAVFMCIGFFVGGFLGAKVVSQISIELLRKIFGIFLIIIAINMIFFKK